MLRGRTLTLVNLALAAGLAIAGADLLAQTTQPTTESGVTATICGPGTIEECGYRDLTECSFKIEFNFAMLAYTGGFSFVRQECKVVGRVAMYKDRPATTTYPTCSSTGRRGNEDEPCVDEGYGGWSYDEESWW